LISAPEVVPAKGTMRTWRPVSLEEKGTTKDERPAAVGKSVGKKESTSSTVVVQEKGTMENWAPVAAPKPVQKKGVMPSLASQAEANSSKEIKREWPIMVSDLIDL
jgi:hypothetical protein